MAFNIITCTWYHDCYTFAWSRLLRDDSCCGEQLLIPCIKVPLYSSHISDVAAKTWLICPENELKKEGGTRK